MNHSPPSLQEDLREVLNRHSAENGSNTPDFILAQYLNDCLAAWNKGIELRSKWYGREDKPGQSGGSGPVPVDPRT